ncbi:357_t:CDS:10 [Paraglomus brasilianum]|uniref:Mediator of RNA polymerase II transcription subunit 5 n=1 Tax=Paraglomus brasilianum TaxID=144538 RepID=A0A9N9A5V2_9GLOM|nr:357_t:CDS:10 [Paraglomus brasilianum]
MPIDMAVDYLEKLQRVQNAFNQTFYVELWMAALTGLAEACGSRENAASHILLWKSFVLVKLPTLIAKLEALKQERMQDITYDDEAKYRCHESVINQLFGFRGLINACNQLPKSIDGEKAVDVSTDILKVCEKKNLIRMEFIARLLGDRASGMTWEKSDSMDVESLVSSILSDPSLLDPLVFTPISTFSDQETRVEIVVKLATRWSSEKQIRLLGTLCKILNDNFELLNAIFLYSHPSQLLAPLDELCSIWTNPESDEIDDYVQDYENFGHIFFLICSIVNRYELHKNLEDVFQGTSGFMYKYFLLTPGTITPEGQQDLLVKQWVDTLLKEATVPDGIIRSTHPRKMIDLAPVIIDRLCDNCEKKVISQEVLLSRLEIFLQPRWSYALITICQWLCEESLTLGRSPRELSISQSSPLLLNVLKHLVLREEFPSIVSRSVGHLIQTTLIGAKLPASDVEDMRTKIESSLDSVWRTKKYSIETLTRRFRKMFHVVVMSGRSSFVQDRVLSISCPHHFDVELIRDVLEVGGARLFVELIGEVISATSKIGGGKRAAELGASILITPLSYTSNSRLHPPHLAHILFSDILIDLIDRKITSYAQGYSLGLLTAHVLLRIDPSARVEEKTLHEHFTECILSKFKSEDDDEYAGSEDSMDIDWRSGKVYDWVPSNGPARGFADGLVANAEMVERIAGSSVFERD